MTFKDKFYNAYGTARRQLGDRVYLVEANYDTIKAMQANLQWVDNSNGAVYHPGSPIIGWVYDIRVRLNHSLLDGQLIFEAN